MLPIKEEVGNFDSYSVNNAKCSKLNCLFVCISLRQSNISDCQIHNIILLPLFKWWMVCWGFECSRRVVVLLMSHQEATWNLFLKVSVVLWKDLGGYCEPVKKFWPVHACPANSISVNEPFRGVSDRNVWVVLGLENCSTVRDLSRRGDRSTLSGNALNPWFCRCLPLRETGRDPGPAVWCSPVSEPIGGSRLRGVWVGGEPIRSTPVCSLVPLRTSSLYTLGIFSLWESEVREGSLLCARVFFAEVCGPRASVIRARRFGAEERTAYPTPSGLSSCSLCVLSAKQVGLCWSGFAWIVITPFKSL